MTKIVAAPAFSIERVSETNQKNNPALVGDGVD
jgi:hypothetical protein